MEGDAAAVMRWGVRSLDRSPAFGRYSPGAVASGFFVGFVSAFVGGGVGRPMPLGAFRGSPDGFAAPGVGTADFVGVPTTGAPSTRSRAITRSERFRFWL